MSSSDFIIHKKDENSERIWMNVGWWLMKKWMKMSWKPVEAPPLCYSVHLLVSVPTPRSQNRFPVCAQGRCCVWAPSEDIIHFTFIRYRITCVVHPHPSPSNLIHLGLYVNIIHMLKMNASVRHYPTPLDGTYSIFDLFLWKTLHCGCGAQNVGQLYNCEGQD